MSLTPEEELALRLCGSAARRRADESTIQGLARVVDPDHLLAVLESQRIVALVGARLEQLAPGQMPETFQLSVAEHTAVNRHRGALFSHLSQDICGLLEAAGIRTVPLKGASLAERAHGDLGLRSAQSDIDILVDAEKLREAVVTLEEGGFQSYDDIDWGGGLPHYHSRLARTDPVGVKVELHWRFHWYETQFARCVLDRADVGPDGERRIQPSDEIALLLLVLARDGYTGLRLPADIAAWWDRHGGEFSRAPLDQVINEHPRLRYPLLAAADVVEREVGVPSGELVDPTIPRSGRVRLATRLAQWSMQGREEDMVTNITLNDLLLTPRGAYHVYFRHYFLQPVDHYRSVYGWPESHRMRNQLKRFGHAAVRGARTAVRYWRRLWSLRGGRSWADLPEFSTSKPQGRAMRTVEKKGLAWR